MKTHRLVTGFHFLDRTDGNCFTSNFGNDLRVGVVNE